MTAINIGLMWLIVSGVVSSVVGHFTTEEVGGWAGSILFFGGIALMIRSWLSSGSGSTRSTPHDIPVHHDVLGGSDDG